MKLGNLQTREIYLPGEKIFRVWTQGEVDHKRTQLPLGKLGNGGTKEKNMCDHFKLPTLSKSLVYNNHGELFFVGSIMSFYKMHNLEPSFVFRLEFVEFFSHPSKMAFYTMTCNHQQAYNWSKY